MHGVVVQRYWARSDSEGMSQAWVEHEERSVREGFPAFRWQRLAAPSPRALPAVGLELARVALVSTAGAHLGREDRFARGNAGDDSVRRIPSSTPKTSVLLSHPGYDTRRASEDVDVVFPLGALNRMAERGVIGSLATTAYYARVRHGGAISPARLASAGCESGRLGPRPTVLQNNDRVPLRWPDMLRHRDS